MSPSSLRAVIKYLYLHNKIIAQIYAQQRDTVLVFRKDKKLETIGY